MKKRMLLVVVVYSATVLLIFAVGFAAGDNSRYSMGAASLILLAFLPGVLRFTGLGGEAPKLQPVSRIFIRHLTVFGLAMAGRILFIFFFNQPAEKIPVVYLILLTVLWVEGRSVGDIGLSGVRWRRSVLAGIIFGVTYYYVSHGVYITGARTLLGISPNLIAVSYSLYEVAWVIVASFLLSGLSEEMLFRGYLQGGVKDTIGSGKAIVYSALLFGLWHTAWGIPLVERPGFAAVYAASYMLFTSLSGIVLGVAYSSTGRLIIPVLIHGFWNTLSSLTPLSSRGSTLFIGDVWRPLSFGLVVLLLYFVIPKICRSMKC